jgi:hypothetical protein
LAERIFALVNPFFISVFLAFFGFTGLVCVLTNRSLGLLSLIPAIAAGLGVNWILKAIIRWMFTKLESSTSVVRGDLIGQPAAVSVPISGSRVGEITCVAYAKRHTFPAKPVNPQDDFKKGAPVVISGFAGNVACVEPWTDSFDPSFKDMLPNADSSTRPSSAQENN